METQLHNLCFFWQNIRIDLCTFAMETRLLTVNTDVSSLLGNNFHLEERRRHCVSAELGTMRHCMTGKTLDFGSKLNPSLLLVTPTWQTPLLNPMIYFLVELIPPVEEWKLKRMKWEWDGSVSHCRIWVGKQSEGRKWSRSIWRGRWGVGALDKGEGSKKKSASFTKRWTLPDTRKKLSQIKNFFLKSSNLRAASAFLYLQT